VKSSVIVLLMFGSICSYATHQPARIVPCDEKKAHEVRIPRSRVTVLNFPVKPKEVVPGENVFDFKSIRNDLAVKALTSQARTNVFIYLDNRRCAFSLITVPVSGDEIVLVRDANNREVEVNFRE
jgi:hypothetical protein